ncbi:MAG: hypothetical protein K0B81_04625 [Candidatus Cloacimonetes bacterium]|nr:hypothetical protein [Candidatus Cloacimonadota bacterium]
MNSSFKLCGLLCAIVVYAGQISFCFAQIPASMEYDQIEISSSEKSVFQSFLKSAVVPGWGELSLGNKSGYVFLASELLLWSGRLYFLEEVKLREEEAYVYAMKYAGLQPGKYSNDYFDLLSRYNSSGFETGGYNEMVLIRAQTLYPDDTEAQNQYILDNAILDQSLYWDWETRENRRQYSIMRKNADHNRDYAKAVIGVIVANHVISAINAVRVTSNINRRNRIQVGLDFDRKDMIPLIKASYRF